MDSRAYPVTVRPLRPDEGIGYLAEVPDLPGCMSDGATPEEAVRNVQGAILSWLEAAEELGRPVPPPSAGTVAPPTTFRRRRHSDTWHFDPLCSFWPTVDFVETTTAPRSGELCNECQAKARGNRSAAYGT